MDKQLTGNALAQALLELHVQHELRAFELEQFLAWTQSELQLLWPQLSRIRLEEFVPRAAVLNTIQRNVIDPEIPGAIAEIAGECAAGLFEADFHLKTRMSDIISSRQLEEMVDKALELQVPRDAWLSNLIKQPVYGQLISDVVYRALVRYLTRDNVLSKKVPGVKKMVSLSTRMVNKTLPKLEGAVEQSVKAFIADNTGVLLAQSQEFLSQALADEELKEFALSFWQLVEGKSLGEIQQGISNVDLSEFVVLGYEFWLKYRQSAYFKQASEFVVNHLFDKYGQEPLAELFDDFHVVPELIQGELQEFAPTVLRQLKEKGVIEQVLRRRLGAFYGSPEVANVISAGAQSH